MIFNDFYIYSSMLYNQEMISNMRGNYSIKIDVIHYIISVSFIIGYRFGTSDRYRNTGPH